MTAQLLWAIVPGYALVGAFVGGRLHSLMRESEERELLLVACIPLWPFVLCAALGMRKPTNLPVARVLK